MEKTSHYFTRTRKAININRKRGKRTVMKVKYMNLIDYINFEEAINDFIKGKKVMDIKFQDNLDKDDDCITSVLILYEE